MSAGHRDATPAPSAELVSKITPEVRVAIARRIASATIVRDFDIPLVGGTSEPWGKVFVDRDLPDEMTADGKTFSPDETLPHHEIPEQYLHDELGFSYDDAHDCATFLFERPFVKSKGIKFEAYQDAFRGAVKVDDHEKIRRCPSDLALWAYEDHEDAALLARVVRAMRDEAAKGEITMAKSSDEIRFYMPISKVDKKQRMVFGYASTEALDLDGEIVSKDAVADALPGYMEWRNIREMHRPLAVGTAKQASMDDKGLWIGAKVVDDEAWKKCLPDEDGDAVYRGFSIGGRKIAKSGNTITELELIEISLVDRPANPECKIEIVKGAKQQHAGVDLIKLAGVADDEPVAIEREELGVLGRLLAKLAGSPVTKREFSDKERDAAAETGAALPDGSFPIKSKKDVENAVEAHGRAKNKARAKRHIIRRAKALGHTDALPDDWKSQKLAKGSASLWSVGRMIELLGSLEGCEEGLEYECAYPSSDRVMIPKSLTDRFGNLLVEFADLCAEVLDHIIQAMDDEEASEAMTEAAKMMKDGGARNARLGALIKVLGGSPADTVTADDREGADDEPLAALAKLKELTKMTTQDPELAKRIASAMKMSIGKAVEHIGKAQKLHAQGTAAMAKCANCFTTAKRATADGFNQDEAAGHLSKAADAFSAMADHQDIAAHHITKVASAWGSGSGLPTMTGGSIRTAGQSEMTEGEVPEYEADMPYAGKGAEINAEAIAKMVAEGITKAMTAQSESKLEKTLETLTETLQRMPAPGRNSNVRLFSPDKTAFAGATGDGKEAPMAKLMDGVMFDQQDPESRNRAAGRMIANMVSDTLAGGTTFGKSPVSDPTFRGGAAGWTN